MARPRFPKDAQELLHWYERYISPLSLIAGFLADNFYLLRRVDLLRSNLLLFTYLIVSALGILFINLVETGRLSAKWAIRTAPYVPIAVQFSFGGLFSGYLSLYSRSAAMPATWVFVVVLAALLLGNERFLKLYRRFTFQVTLYFTVLFSFFIFFLPVIFHEVGVRMFIISGLAALGVSALFVHGMRLLMPQLVKRERVRVARSIAAVYLIFNTLYFLGAIPPLPLALKDGGVYHSLTRSLDGTYTLQGEAAPWWSVVFPYDTVVHHVSGRPVYVWSAVFAPSGLSTSILHVWQHYDESSGKWVTVSTIGFPINGGRDGGYRGYTTRSDLPDGKWRVNVTTPSGQVIGQVAFTVVTVPTEPEMRTVTK